MLLNPDSLVLNQINETTVEWNERSVLFVLCYARTFMEDLYFNCYLRLWLYNDIISNKLLTQDGYVFFT